MAWNYGYTIFETTVIGAYDLGKLDKALLAVLMEPYRGTDIDRAGSVGPTSQDGKTVEQIVIETWGLPMPSEPASEDDDDWDNYQETLDDTFRQVTTHFGWC